MVVRYPENLQNIQVIGDLYAPLFTFTTNSTKLTPFVKYNNLFLTYRAIYSNGPLTTYLALYDYITYIGLRDHTFSAQSGQTATTRDQVKLNITGNFYNINYILIINIIYKLLII